MLRYPRIRNSDKAQKGRLESAPQCLGPQLEGLEAGGLNHLKARSHMSGGGGQLPTGDLSSSPCGRVWTSSLHGGQVPGPGIPRQSQAQAVCFQ